MFKQKSIKIFHSVQEIRPFSLFLNLALGKASADDKCHFAIVSIFSEFEPRQKLNQSQISFDNLMGYIKDSTNEKCILQSLGLDLVNINVYATVYQNIPHSLDRAIFTFSEFGAQQSLDR